MNEHTPRESGATICDIHICKCGEIECPVAYSTCLSEFRQGKCLELWKIKIAEIHASVFAFQIVQPYRSTPKIFIISFNISSDFRGEREACDNVIHITIESCRDAFYKIFKTTVRNILWYHTLCRGDIPQGSDTGKMSYGFYTARRIRGGGLITLVFHTVYIELTAFRRVGDNGSRDVLNADKHQQQQQEYTLEDFRRFHSSLNPAAL